MKAVIECQEFDGGWNVYAFCDNDPVNSTDPSGMCESVAWAWVKGFGQGFTEGAVKGGSAAVDVVVPFCDPFSSLYRDENGDLEDDVYLISQGFGEVSREAFYTVASMRLLAFFSRFRPFRFLNQNRYLRIGKGNIPKNKPLTDGPGQNVPTLRIGNGKPSIFNHFDLRAWGF